MGRRILGVLAATIAAPYLGVFFGSLFDLLSGDSAGPKGPLELLITIIFLGTFPLLMFGLPLLILAGICAALVHLVEQPTWRAPVLVGAVLGFGFVATVFVRRLEYDWTFTALSSGLCSGAICGWIYWRIALRGQSDPAQPEPETRAS